MHVSDVNLNPTACSVPKTHNPVQNFSHDEIASSNLQGDPNVTSHIPADPFFLEICAGSARVTTCLQQLGLKSSFGVDHKRSKDAGRLLVADLTTPEGQALCWQWVKSPNCVGIFCAPPCGTCSRARGIPVRLPSGKKIPGPKPLRSEEQPDGFKHLTGTDKLRVKSANVLYQFITDLCLHCIARSLIVCIENPRQSLYWRTSFFAPLKELLSFAVHQACAYGSERPKWTALAHNTQTLHDLNHTCPGEDHKHKHKPWGMTSNASFSTAEETAYPMQLAFAIAFFLVKQLVLKGWKPPSEILSLPDDISYQYLRSVTGVQPKSSKIPPLVSEFSAIIDIDVAHDTPLPIVPGDKLPKPWQNVPAGACLLKKQIVRSNGGMGKIQPGMKRVSFGVFRSSQEFVKTAVLAGHPISRETKLPAALDAAVDFLNNNPMHVVARHRLSELERWLDRAKALIEDEDTLHKSLDPALKGILAPKRLLLWREMMVHYKYPDCEVFDEVVSGTKLSGVAPAVPSLEACFKPAKLTESELASTARAARIGLLRSVRSSGDPFIDSEVYRKTLEELENGWLDGPHDPESLPEDTVISRRFGILQSSGDASKVRLIDDFSASGVNSTVQVNSCTKLHTLDVAAALILKLLRESKAASWVGKTIDLSAAYRQLGVAAESRWVSFIAVYDPSSKTPKIFAMRALPFGASRSVYSFLRVAHSLWWLGCVALKLPWTNFFDDFITLARSEESVSVEVVTRQFFRLLGWAVSEGEKDLPFSEKFRALGIEVDLSAWSSGVAKFANTSKRTAELVSTIKSVLESRSLPHQAALALRGRMQFAHAQLWGRASKLCLNAVTAHAYSGDGPEISCHLANCLELFVQSLEESKPREISLWWDVPFFLFTDASFEPTDAGWPCGIGGVLVGPSGEQISAISFCLDMSDLECLGYPSRSTVIFEAELLALIVCFKIWKRHLRHRPCVMYIDNNATRDVSISGRARTAPASNLVAELLMLEDRNCTNTWFARVPSASNLADGPSRNDLAEITAGCVSVDFAKLVAKKVLAGLCPSRPP